MYSVCSTEELPGGTPLEFDDRRSCTAKKAPLSFLWAMPPHVVFAVLLEMPISLLLLSRVCMRLGTYAMPWVLHPQMKLVRRCPHNARKRAYDKDKNIFRCRFSASSCIQHSGRMLRPEEPLLSCPQAILKEFTQCMTLSRVILGAMSM